MPSTRSDANASASAWPQSIPPSSSASAAPLELARELRVDREAVRDGARALGRARAAGSAATAVDTSPSRAGGVARLFLGGSAMDSRSRSCAASIALVRCSADQRWASSAVTTPSRDELRRRTARAPSGARAIALRHQRLRVGRLVLLVMAESAVADEVDDDVVAEALAGRRARAGRPRRGLGVVGIHVDDRRVEALREVARVARRAAFGRVGGEADLVVRDQMQRAAGRVAGEAPRG